MLRAKTRNALPESDFALPGRRYPIHDASHAQNALARVSQHGSPEEKKKVRAAVHRRYPDMGAGSKPKGKAGSGPKNKAEKSPGVPEFATDTPTKTGTLRSGQSGLSGGVTETCPDCSGAGYMTKREGFEAWIRPGMACPTCLGKGIIIPSERNLDRSLVPNVSANYPDPMTGVGKADDGLIHVIDGPANKDQISTTNSNATTPGSPEWESYDSATLDRVAQGLATCGRAVDAIRQREAVEAASGDPGDWKDALDLDTAGEAIDCALGFVARLAYHEGAESVTKSGRRLSTASEGRIRTARDHLTHLLGDGESKQPTGATGDSSEEDIMAVLTKEDLTTLVTEAAKDAVAGPTKDARRAAKTARKALKAAKQATKAAKTKTSNNNGEVTEADMRSNISGTADADDVSVAGGKVKPEFKASKSEKRLSKQLAATGEVLTRLEETVTKMARSPRRGGPVLDGVARGGFPAPEGRQTEQVAKSAEDTEIERLEKSMSEATDNQMRAEYSQQLTLARLRQAHEQGLI